jgi:hypothetical protein
VAAVEAGPVQVADGLVRPATGVGEVDAAAGDGEHPAAGGHEVAGGVAGDTGGEHLDAVDGPGPVEALDAVAGAGRLGVALGRADDGDAAVGAERRLADERAGRRRRQQLGQVGRHAGQDRLGLRIAEADVVLDHPGAVRGEHETGVEEAPVVDAAALQLGQRGLDVLLHDLVDQALGQVGDRRVGAHASGVRPGVAVAHPLVVAGDAHQRGPLAVAEREDRQLGAGHALLDHHRAAGVAERLAGELGADVGLGLGPGGRHQHALAGGQPVGLDHPRPGELVEEGDGLVGVAEDPVPGGGHAGVEQHVLHEGLRSLQPCAVGPWTEHEAAGGAQPVGQAVDQRDLGPDDEQVRVELLGRRGDRTGDAGVPGRDQHLGAPGEHRREGVLPGPAADDDDAHQAPRCTNCSRPGPVPTRRIGTPTCCSRKAR